MIKKCNLVVLNLLLAVSALAEWTNDYIMMKREHSLMKPYKGNDMIVRYWDFQGVTSVTSNYVRVTPDIPHKSGSLWNNIPCNVVSWEMQIYFKIHGQSLGADGMAFWYTRDKMVPGPVFGSHDYFYGLAIFIDTFRNRDRINRHLPYISAMVNNGTVHYAHDSDGTHTALAARCEAKLRNVPFDTSIAIRYEKDTLTVMTDVDNKGEFKECLKVAGVKLPTGYYFGVSAATGDLSDNHDILAMKLYQLDSSDVISGEARCALVEGTNDYNIMKREHSLMKPYKGNDIIVRYWDFQGVTSVTSNYVRVTPDIRHKSGSLWNNIPCNVVSWEMQIYFKIHGQNDGARGMAFWYTRDKMVPGPVFGSHDYFYGLAVFIDTFRNRYGINRHLPYISAMINNGTLHYDHDTHGTHTALAAGCEAKLRNVPFDTSIAIRYEKDTLTVMTDVENKGEFKECLKVAGIELPTGYYFGVSAATGDLSDNHDILAMKLYELNSSDVICREDRSKIIPFVYEPPREEPSWLGTSWLGTSWLGTTWLGRFWKSEEPRDLMEFVIAQIRDRDL